MTIYTVISVVIPSSAVISQILMIAESLCSIYFLQSIGENTLANIIYPNKNFFEFNSELVIKNQMEELSLAIYGIKKEDIYKLVQNEFLKNFGDSDIVELTKSVATCFVTNRKYYVVKN